MSKKIKAMGKVYKRGKNYYIDVRSNGKRIRRKVGPSKKLAALVLKDAEIQLAKNKFDFDIISLLSGLLNRILQLIHNR